MSISIERAKDKKFFFRIRFTQRNMVNGITVTRKHTVYKQLVAFAKRYNSVGFWVTDNTLKVPTKKYIDMGEQPIRGSQETDLEDSFTHGLE